MKKEAVKFYQTYKFSIFPFIVVFSSLILIIFVIYPQASRLLTGQKTEIEILEKAKVLEAKAETLESYDPGGLSSKVGYTLASFPVDQDFTTGITLLQDLSARSGFAITSIAVGIAPVTGKSSQSYNIKLDLSGPENLLPIFLSSIEDSPRLMKISSLEVSARAGQLAAISLSIDILYSPIPGNFGSVDSPLPALSADDEEILTKIARVSSTASIISPLFQQPLQQPLQQPQDSTNLPPRGKLNPFE